MRGWYGNKHKHSLASRGIKTKHISKGFERYLPLTSKNLTMAIKEERDDMISYFSITEEKINEGACGTFATRVAERFFPELVVHEVEEDDVYGKEFVILSTRPFPNFEATEKMKWCSSRLMGGHTWISYNGLHYDSEVPYGVVNPEDLPFLNGVCYMVNIRRAVNERLVWQFTQTCSGIQRNTYNIRESWRGILSW